MSDPEGRRRIHGRKLLLALHEAGIIEYGDYVRRVVIDASVEGAAVMHVERYGDERLLNVALTGGGLEVDTKEPAEEDFKAQIQELLAANADLQRRLDAKDDAPQ